MTPYRDCSEIDVYICTIQNLYFQSRPILR